MIFLQGEGRAELDILAIYGCCKGGANPPVIFFKKKILASPPPQKKPIQARFFAIRLYICQKRVLGISRCFFFKTVRPGTYSLRYNNLE